MMPQAPADLDQATLSFTVRKIVRESSRASLGTVMTKGQGPYVSLVTVATDFDGSPLLLLSTLADHTRNIAADPRVSLLCDATAGHANPQAGPRVSLEGLAERHDDAGAKRRFLARHPKAALYAGFGDFALYRIKPARAHWVGGFGRARWIDEGLSVTGADAFAKAEAALVDEIGKDDPELAARLANNVLHKRGKTWKLVAADADGVDLSNGTAVIRLSFEAPLDSPRDVRAVLAALASKPDRT